MLGSETNALPLTTRRGLLKRRKGRDLFLLKGSASNCRSLFCSWWHKRVESSERSGGTKVLSESKKSFFAKDLLSFFFLTNFLDIFQSNSTTSTWNDFSSFLKNFVLNPDFHIVWKLKKTIPKRCLNFHARNKKKIDTKIQMVKIANETFWWFSYILCMIWKEWSFYRSFTTTTIPFYHFFMIGGKEIR